MARRVKRRSGSIAPASSGVIIKEDPSAVDEPQSEHSKPLLEKESLGSGESALGMKRPRSDDDIADVTNTEQVDPEYLRQKVVLQEHHRGVVGIGHHHVASSDPQCHTYQAQAELRSQHHTQVKRLLRFEGEAMRAYRDLVEGEAGPTSAAEIVDSSFEPSGVPFDGKAEGDHNEEPTESPDELPPTVGEDINGACDDDAAIMGDRGVTQNMGKKIEELTRSVQVVVGKQTKDEYEQRFRRRISTELTTGVCLWNDVSPILYGRVLQCIQFYCAKMLQARKLDKPLFPPEDSQLQSHEHDVHREGRPNCDKIVTKQLTSAESQEHPVAQDSDNDTVIESDHEQMPTVDAQGNEDEGSGTDEEDEEDVEDYVDDDEESDDELFDDDDDDRDEEQDEGGNDCVEDDEQGINTFEGNGEPQGEPNIEGAAEAVRDKAHGLEEVAELHAPEEIADERSGHQPSPWNESPWDDMYIEQKALADQEQQLPTAPPAVAGVTGGETSTMNNASEESSAPTPTAATIQERPPKRVLLVSPDDNQAAADVHQSAQRRRSLSWICYPRIQRMASALMEAISETFDIAAARSLHSNMSASQWDAWSAQRKLELKYAVNKIFLIFNNTDLRLLDVTRKVTRVIEGLGFVDQGISLVWHDVCLMRAAETQCYSYHPRLFSTMSTLNANQNPFALMAVRNLELSDKRIGKIPSISRRHPHPEVNTAVLLCEPKKKKGTIDEFRTLPHPKKAGIHAVEDFLVGEELLYRQCIQLKDHLNKVGSLKGLPIHLNSLIYELVDYDIEDFAKLQSAKKQFLANAPQALMRRITDGLKSRLANLEASREATRLAVGTIGFYCQGVVWRDQVLAAAQNYGAQSHYYLGLSEWELTQQQSLLPNFFADPLYGPGLEAALRHFLRSETDPTWLPVFEVLIPMLQGKWRQDEVRRFSDEEPDRAQRMRQWWGSIGETTEYLAPSWVIFGLQSLVIVGELLQSSWLNTVCDPVEFLITFADSGKWKSDDTAAQYLASAEKTTNLATARLAAIGMAINSLRIRLTVINQEKSIAFLEQFVELQKNAPPYAKGASYPCYQLMDADKSVATTLIGKVIVSTMSVGHHIPPALVIADAHRGSESDIRTFFGPLKVRDAF